MTLATLLTLLALMAMVYSGWNEAIASADKRYVKRDEFKTFEFKLFIRQTRTKLTTINRDIDMYQAKMDTGVVLATWEKRMYQKALMNKLRCEKEIETLLNNKGL